MSDEHDPIDALGEAIEKARGKGLLPKGGTSKLHRSLDRSQRKNRKNSYEKSPGRFARAQDAKGYLATRRANNWADADRIRHKDGGYVIRRGVYKADDIHKAKAKTLYVYRPVENAEDIIAWAKGQGFKSLLPAEKLHVTLIASATELNWATLYDDHHLEPATERASMCDCGPVYRWEDRAKTKTIEGGAREVKKLGDKAIVLGFESLSLMQRYVDLRRAGATSKFSAFQAHITLTLSGDVPKDITPYEGKIVLGEECWEEHKDGAYDNVEEVVTKAALDEFRARLAALEAKPKEAA